MPLMLRGRTFSLVRLARDMRGIDTFLRVTTFSFSYARKKSPRVGDYPPILAFAAAHRLFNSAK